ncbi:MAG TPA: phage terminase large subunit family protein [Candidatus Nitrosotalea sp.]|nr:phage terminase large subunit family protein [Candidatus Nitrosotalea sp.]
MAWKKILSLIPDESSDEDDPIVISSRIPSNKIEFVEKFRRLDGKPFSFQDRDYLKPIYLDNSREINIVKSRQMEITELALNWLLFNLLKHPYTTGLYMTDRYEHVKDFSVTRLQTKAIEQSELLKSFTVLGEHSITRQKFTNDSNLRMLSAWDKFEAARSIPADFVVIDEIQAVDVSSLSVVKESMSKSKYKKILKIGTGSDEGDEWFDEWHRGTQFHWKKDIVNQNGSLGSWVQDPNSPTVPGITSYAINQHMAPWISAQEIEEKRVGKGYSPRQFENEVLGWWHRGMRRPLTTKEMMTLFDKNLDFTPSERVNHTLPIYAGFDWGGGTQAHTVAWIWQLVNDSIPRFKLLHLEKIDNPSTEAQADAAIELIRKFEVDQVVMDAGGGTRQVEKVSKTFGSRVFKVNYRYDAVNPVEIFRKEHRLNCDRTWIIETIIDLIKRPEPNEKYPNGVPRIHLPYRDPLKIEWIIDHFTCIEAETASAGGKEFVKYVHDESTNDDAIHAAGYAYLAWVVHQGAGWTWVRFG